MKNQIAQINLFELISHLSLNELTTLAKVTGKSFLTYARTPKMVGKFTQFSNLSDEQLEEVAELVEQRIEVERAIRQIKKDNGFKSLKEVRELVCVSVFELKSEEEIAELVTSNQLDWINCENNVEIAFSPRQIQIQDIIKQAKQASLDNVESTRLARQVVIAEHFAEFATDDKALNDETIANFIKIECGKTGCASRTIRQDVQQLALRNVA